MRYLAPLRVLTPLRRGGCFLPFLATLLLLFSSSISSQPSQALPRPHLGYGVFVANLGNLNMVNGLGFGWFAHPLFWSGAEETNNDYQPGNLDNIIDAAQGNNLKLILRVSDAPGWAWNMGNPPQWADEFGDFMAWVAQRVNSRAPDLEVAYVIWNEPNLPIEWGGRTPQPSWMAALLQATYPRIKAVDPDAVVIAPGMATTGGRGGAACGVGTGIALQEVSPFTQKLYAAGAISDLDFICGIYLNGGKDYFDVLSSHPYGFAAPFDELPSTGLAFRRVEQQRAVMEAMGDGDRQIWALEFGWILYPGESCHYTHDWESRWGQIVSETEQATNLAGAYGYAYHNWPWMEVIHFFNLDFATVPWYGYCQPMRWYSVVYRDTPGVGDLKYRLAYYALRDMVKPTSGPFKAYLPLLYKVY